MRPRLLLFPFVAAVALSSGPRSVSAEDVLVTATVDLDLVAPTPTVGGPGLWCVGDPSVRDSGIPDGPNDWDVKEGAFGLFEFAEPQGVVPTDAYVDLVRRLVPAFEEREGFRLEGRRRRLEVRADAATLTKVREVVARLRAALAPRLAVSGRLVAEEQAGARLVAAGGASLLPRVWTRLWRQQHDRRFPLGYDIEIAQESTAQDPYIRGVPEGTEVYLRWTPGETVSIVEAWAGVLDHLEPTKVDLSGIRNVPEGNAYSRVEYPKTAVRRAFPAFTVPVDAASGREVAWDGPGGRRVLRLDFSPPTPSPDPFPVGAQVLAVLRIGAVGASLDGEAREPSEDEWANRMRTLPGDHSVDTLAGAFLYVHAAPEAVAAFRAGVVEAEERLAGATVEVRAVAVGEADLRRVLEGGQAVVGAPLSREVEEALLASSSPVASVRLPVTAEVVAGLRVGTAELALHDVDVEVAQQSAGIDPVERGLFAGLVGTVRVVGLDGGGLGLELDGSMGWRAADAPVELAFRPPVGMSFNREGVKAEDATPRRVTLPFASRGGAFLQARASFPAGAVAEGRPALLAVVSRQGGEALPETVVLLGSLRR